MRELSALLSFVPYFNLANSARVQLLPHAVSPLSLSHLAMEDT